MSTDTRTSRTFDALGLLADTLATYVGSGVTTVNGSPRVVDLGDADAKGVVQVDVSQLDLSSGDETYRLSLQGCTSLGFVSGVVDLGSVSLPNAGRYEIDFRTRQDAKTYRYVRAYATLAGTTPSMQVVAFITRL